MISAVSEATVPKISVIVHLASEMVVDAVVDPGDLRADLIRRFALAASRDWGFAERRNPVTPA